MLDVEKVKTILQAEVNKREKAREKWMKYLSSGDKYKAELYEKRYHTYCSRFDGMCDMLFDLGYQAWSNQEQKVIVEKLVEGDNYLSVEIPF